MQVLAGAGYTTLRMAGSHGTFDVAAIGPCGVRFIQIKRIKPGGNWRSEYELAKESISHLPKLAGVSYEVWVWEDNKGWILQEVVR